jgi:hypothetical protein
LDHDRVVEPDPQNNTISWRQLRAQQAPRGQKVRASPLTGYG